MNDSERRERLRVLFEAHAEAVKAYASRRIDPSAADDTVSEVFVVACRRLDEVPRDALPWLLACARRVLANQRRSARRQTALIDRLYREPPPAGKAEFATSVLMRALSDLEEHDREVLLLVAWEGLDAVRAAAALECSRAVFAVRLHRARRRLAVALAQVESTDSVKPTSMEAVR